MRLSFLKQRSLVKKKIIMPIQQKAKEQAAAMCATSSIPDTSVDIAINNEVNVSVLNIGVQFTYRIPSFSVIEVELH